MAEEEVVALSPTMPSDHKRKHDEFEPQESKPGDPSLEPDATKNDEAVAADSLDTKRPRLDDNPEKTDEPVTENDDQRVVENNTLLEEAQPTSKEASEAVENEELGADKHETGETEKHAVENSDMEHDQKASKVLEESQQPSVEVPQQGDVSSALQEETTSETQMMSRRMDVPNNKVGVLIGKAGDTIRYLQYNSGAKIQITKDGDTDLHSATRPVELTGSLESINMAEKLIKDVIAEADVGGSPSLVARGLATAQAAGVAEQIQIQVPNEKVGLIIGRGGETIKGLQTRSGASIQLTPQHLPEGDKSKERTVRVTGDKKQIEMAREMIKEVMSQIWILPVTSPVRSSSVSSGFNQQSYRTRGSASSSQWGQHGTHHARSMGYDYQQQGPYSSQNLQHRPPTYGGYPPQQLALRNNFGSGWDQRLSAPMQGHPTQNDGYNYYGGQGGPHSTSIPTRGHGPIPAPGMGPAPSQANYNYGQSHGPDYGQSAPYSQSAPHQQSYGYEPKYENQAPPQHPYGGQGTSQPVYPQGTQAGFAPQQQYGKPPQPYGMQSQGQPPQSHGPRVSQPGEMAYQGSIPSSQTYGSNIPPQPYPYAASAPLQQTYPTYGSQPSTDGHNQPLPASGPAYPQHGTQAVPNYGQSGGQQAPAYAQEGYAQYPSSQPGYPEQPAPNNAGYAYQEPQDPGYSSGPGLAYSAAQGGAGGQAGYAQPTTQPSYDQSIPQSGGYGAAPGSAPVAYPQYETTQMYAAPR